MLGIFARDITAFARDITAFARDITQSKKEMNSINCKVKVTLCFNEN